MFILELFGAQNIVAAVWSNVGDAISLEPAGIVPIAKSCSDLMAAQDLVKRVQIEDNVLGHNVTLYSTIQFWSPPTIRSCGVQVMVLELKDILSLQDLSQVFYLSAEVFDSCTLIDAEIVSSQVRHWELMLFCERFDLLSLLCDWGTRQDRDFIL
jgi:hypothetical protein